MLASAAALRYEPVRRSKHGAAAVSMLGFIVRHVDGFATDPVYGDLLNAAERACSAHGLSLAHAQLPPNAERVDALPPMILRRQVQGVLVVGVFRHALLALMEQMGIPWVLVDHFEEDIPTDCITGRDEYGAYLATRHLLDLGHRAPPPAMILAPPGHGFGPNVETRWRGYCRALAEQGVPYDEAYVQRAETGRAVDALLALPAPPTAVFCWNDGHALAAMARLRERGVAVPEECSVVGYDDTYLAPRSVPPLTTIRVNRQLMARQSVTHLLERIAEPGLPARHTSLAVTLVQRASTAQRKGSLLG